VVTSKTWSGGLSADLEAWAALVPSAERPAVIHFPEMDEASRIAALAVERRKRRVLFARKAAGKPVYSPAAQKESFELRPGVLPRAKLLEKLAKGGYLARHGGLEARSPFGGKWWTLAATMKALATALRRRHARIHP